MLSAQQLLQKSSWTNTTTHEASTRSESLKKTWSHIIETPVTVSLEYKTQDINSYTFGTQRFGKKLKKT